ncbi:hypothetical protein WEI85_19805 [Actinomycetes bacterium KLBMP 9797]
MLTIVVPQLTGGDPPLRIGLQRQGWLDGTRPVYRYEVVYDGVTVLRGQDLRGPAGSPSPPLRASGRALASFLAAAGQSMALRGAASEYWHEYSPQQRRFLTATYERFGALVDT